MPRFEKGKKVWTIRLTTNKCWMEAGPKGEKYLKGHVLTIDAPKELKRTYDAEIKKKLAEGFIKVDVPEVPAKGKTVKYVRGDATWSVTLRARSVDTTGSTHLYDDLVSATAAAENIIAEKISEGFTLAPKATTKRPASAKAVTKGRGAQRYELSSGSSNKFWEIALAGASFTVTFGKIGSAGQTQVKSFASDAAANKAHDALVAEKTKKGYVLVGASSVGAPKKPKAAKQPKPATLAEAIERAKAWMSANGAGVLVKNLARPTTDAALATCEKKLGFALPAELRALWKIHDGQKEEHNGFIGSLDLLGSTDCLAIRDDVLASIDWLLGDDDMLEDAELTKPEQNRDWIPFGTRDSDHLVVHAKTGRVFRVAKDAPPLSLAARSLTQFFSDYVRGMEAGEYTVMPGFGDVYLGS